MRPFRTPGGASLTAAGEPARETDVTLLRGDPDAHHAATVRGGRRPDGIVIEQPEATPDATPRPRLPWPAWTINRNPYFRYQAIQKLGSVVSTHSNVFAIWITVGYFEVMPHVQLELTPGTPTVINWVRSWAATRATSSAIARFTSSTVRSPSVSSAGRTSISRRRFGEQVY